MGLPAAPDRRFYSALGIRIAGEVPEPVISQHTLRVGAPLKANPPVWAQVAVRACNFSATVIAICQNLAAGAIGFAGERRAWMTVSLDREVQITVGCTLHNVRLVEHASQFSLGR